MPTGGEFSKRILVLAPVGRDAALLVGAAQASDLVAQGMGTVDELAERFSEGCGAILLTEEALHQDRGGVLKASVECQPSWSEVPFVILTSRDQARDRVRLTIELMQPLRNVTVLERPVRPATINMALLAALRDRQRQYEIRDALEQLQVANRDLEKRVKERTAELLKKVRELKSFCYSVSHDMRAPLRAMTANARLVLADETEVSDSGRLMLERLSANALKMATLVDDLLTYARLGEADLQVSDINLSELVGLVVSEVSEERGLPTVESGVEGGLWVRADARLLRLAIHNLVENSLKYQAPGSVPSVWFGRDSTGAYFLRDNGIGFEMAYVEKIFLPFERLHRDVEYPGTGIGLANVRRVFEMHGGRIWAESEPNKGSTFFFYLC